MKQIDIAPYNKGSYNYKKINGKNAKKILDNLKKLYVNCKKNQKSNIIQIVSNIFSRKYLNKYGFEVTKTIYTTSKRKAENEEFNLNDYKRFKPLSKLKTSNEIKNQIVKFTKKYSIESKKTLNNQNVFFLQQTKKYIYEKYLENYPNSKICLSTFKKAIPSYFKKPKRESDKCPICDLGKNLISKKILNDDEKLQKDIFLKHEKFKQIQNENYKGQLEKLDDNECIVIMDFKQNIELGKGPIETNHDFYNKQFLSCLGFCIIYKKENKLYKKHVNYLSTILSHDSLFVSHCISNLIKKYIVKKYDNISFWSDNGFHFRSFELYNHIFNNITEKYNLKTTMNFFVEYHGKSDVDGHFGLLQRIYNNVSKTLRVNDIEQLIGIFQNKLNNNEINNTCFEIYNRDKRPLKIRKMLIKNSKRFLSLMKLNGKLYGCSVYSKNVDDYIELDYGIKEAFDTRITKYSFYKSKDHKKYYLGSRFIDMISSRYELANDKCIV